MKPKNIIQISSILITVILCILFVRFELHERAVNHQNITTESKQQTSSISKEIVDFEQDDENILPNEWLGEFLSVENDYLKITNNSFLYQPSDQTEKTISFLVTQALYDDKEKTISLTGPSVDNNNEETVTLNIIEDDELDFNGTILTKQ